jgi:2'-5' RNA ligase
LFFPEEVKHEEFIEEIECAVWNFSQITFSMESAVVHKDSLSEYYYTFLLISNGREIISQMHDHIYGNKLSIHLKNEIPYLPHMTIGSSLDKSEMDSIADEWNGRPIGIQGMIDTISILQFEADKITHLRDIRLK